MKRPQSDGWARFYIPEIHDVHPAMQDRLQRLLDLWPAAAREAVALLVVPRWMGASDLSDHPGFCERLKAHPGEKVLHGWTHTLGPDFLNWLLYGHDNRSEFAGFDATEAARRIAAGVTAFQDSLGTTPRWFCAPRWHQGEAVAPVLQSAGFDGFMLKNHLCLLAGDEVPLPSLCFDEGERRLRTIVARQLREVTIARLLSSGSPFRFTLHPADLDDASTWSQIERLIARLEDDGWAPLSLEQALARWREAGPARNPAAAA